MAPRSEHWADQAGEDSCWIRQPGEWYHSDKRRVFEKRLKKSPSSFCWRGNWKRHPVYGTDLRPYPHGRGTGKHKKNALVNREPAPSCTGRHIQGRSLASQKVPKQSVAHQKICIQHPAPGNVRDRSDKYNDRNDGLLLWQCHLARTVCISRHSQSVLTIYREFLWKKVL